jgi:hypothetical protein
MQAAAAAGAKKKKKGVKMHLDELRGPVRQVRRQQPLPPQQPAGVAARWHLQQATPSRALLPAYSLPVPGLGPT